MTNPIENNNGFGFFRGRVALAAALRGLNLKAGDAVAVQAYTCSALAEAVLSLEMIPVWVDITADGYTMDPADLEKKLAAHGNVKALVVQHTYGLMADMDRLMAIAQKNNLPVIEDCCHTLFSTWNGKMAGSFGDAAFYSFEAGKPLVAGLGGWLRVNNPELLTQVRVIYSEYGMPSMFDQLRTLGMFVAFSILYRPSTFWTIKRIFRFLAKMGIVRGNYNTVETESTLAIDFSDFKKRLGNIQEKTIFFRQDACRRNGVNRKRAAQMYRNQLEAVSLRPLTIDARMDPVILKYPVLVANKPMILSTAEEAQIEVSDNYSTPIHPYEGRTLELAHYAAGSCPQAEYKAKHVVALPCPARFDENQVSRTIHFIKGDLMSFTKKETHPVKRAFDVLASAGGLLAFSPIILTFMYLVWRQDKHSPFYKGERVGMNEAPFKMVKLRSMVMNADKSGVDSTGANDRRITRVGQLIRKYKLDEITQLWNVLKGDMSLVGPRPNVKRETDLYTPLEKKLLSVRPGITDIASIVFADEGDILKDQADPDLAYNQLIRPAKSRLGILYVENASLWLDLRLVFLTALAIVDRQKALDGVQTILDELHADADLKQIAKRVDPLQPAPPPGAAEIVKTREAKAA